MIRPLILGGMVFGDTFLDLFERFCVASMRSPANLEALRDNGAKVVVYTNREDAPRLAAILDGLLPYELRELPPFPKGKLFEMLAAVHAILCKRTSAEGTALHMLMPDQMYSSWYFRNLFRLAERGDVAHGGLNVSLSAAPQLLAYGANGFLSIPAEALGDIGWRHLHHRMSQFLMNRAKVPVSMPDAHFHLWRARDRLMLFSPYFNPVYLTPESARRWPVDATLDAQVQWMVENFFVPSLDDDMVMIGLEHAPWPTHPPVDWATFATRCWKDMGFQAYRIEYYRKPVVEIPAAVIEGAPTAEDVLERQGKIADGIEEWGIVKSLEHKQRSWDEFMAQRRAGAAA